MRTRSRHPRPHRAHACLLAATITATATAAVARGDADAKPHYAEEAAGHSHAHASRHGGAVTMTSAFHFETVFLPQETRVYVYDGQQMPVDLSDTDVAGRVSVQFRDGTHDAIVAPLHLVTPDESEHAMQDGDDDRGMHHEGMAGTMDDDDDDDDGMHHEGMAGMMDDHGGHQMHHQPMGYLTAALDLSGIAPGEARASVSVHDLPSESEPEVTFLQKVRVHAPGEGQEHGMHEGMHDADHGEAHR